MSRLILGLTPTNTKIIKEIKMVEEKVPKQYVDEKAEEEVKYNTILYEKDKEDPHILYITLNRPEKNNAISIGPGCMTAEIPHAFDRASKDDGVKVVILRGAGRSFSAGFDLSMVFRVYGGRPGARPLISKRLQVDFDHVINNANSVSNCTKITIAQVQGWCIEAGMGLALACDIFIAAEDAKFNHRGQRLAFGGQISPTTLIMGHTKKLIEWGITGRTIGGVEAEEMGVITKAVPAEELEEVAYNLAKVCALLPLDAIVMGKMNRIAAFERMGGGGRILGSVWHTLSTNLGYADDEKQDVFIRDRERMGEKAAFHKLHETYEKGLDKTKYFKSFGRD